MPVLDLHKQIHRVVHGGVLAMLADTAGGFAAFLAAPRGSRVATIEMKINFLEAVEHGEIKADARVLRQGRTTSVVDCDVTDQDGRLVSKALMTFSVYLPKRIETEARSRKPIPMIERIAEEIPGTGNSNARIRHGAQF